MRSPESAWIGQEGNCDTNGEGGKGRGKGTVEGGRGGKGEQCSANPTARPRAPPPVCSIPDIFDAASDGDFVAGLEAAALVLGGATAQKIGFSGPALGAKLADANAREFSADQLKKAAATPTMLGTGSHGHEALIVGAEGLASQQGMFDTSKNIVKAGDAPAATAELCAMGQGSAGCASQEGTFDRSREIVKVHG